MSNISTWFWQNPQQPPIKIQIEPSIPLPRMNQHPMSKEALQGLEPIIEDHKAQGFGVENNPQS